MREEDPLARAGEPFEGHTQVFQSLAIEMHKRIVEEERQRHGPRKEVGHRESDGEVELVAGALRELGRRERASVGLHRDQTKAIVDAKRAPR